MLYCLPFKSSGQHADSMNVLLFSSTNAFIDVTSCRNCPDAYGFSWFSLIYAMAADSMWPTSHQQLARIGSNKLTKTIFIIIFIKRLLTRRWA